jgi:hypothetical protein
VQNENEIKLLHSIYIYKKEEEEEERIAGRGD